MTNNTSCQTVKTLYRCPKCGETITDIELDKRAESGGLPYCYCRYSAYDENGDIWFPREFVEYDVYHLSHTTKNGDAE